MCKNATRTVLSCVALVVFAVFTAGEPPGKNRPGRDRPKAEKAAAKGDAQSLGEYVWGPRLAKADIEGRVLVCCLFSGDDRAAPQLPKMVLAQLKVPNPNVALLLVLAGGGEITKALRLLSAGEVALPVITDTTIPEVAEIRVQGPRNQGGKGKGGRGMQSTVYARSPDGKLIFAGAVEPAKLQSVLDDIAKSAAQYPTCFMRGKSFPDSQAAIKQLVTAGAYAPIVSSLRLKAAGKDAAQAEESRTLIANIEDQGAQLLRKAEYLEKTHVPAALETYTAVAKSWKGLDAGAKAEERLAKLKADKATEHEVAAAALAHRIRQDCALLLPAPKAPAVDVSDGGCQSVSANKSVIPRLLQEAAVFRKKYRDTRIAAECLALLRAYGAPEEPPSK